MASPDDGSASLVGSVSFWGWDWGAFVALTQVFMDEGPGPVGGEAPGGVRRPKGRVWGVSAVWGCLSVSSSGTHFGLLVAFHLHVAVS